MSENRIWPRPQVVPLPVTVDGCDMTMLCLNGDDWKLSHQLSEAFYLPEDTATIWEDTTVPMQLLPNTEDYGYAHTFTLPADWNGKNIFLRFDGVNCCARVYINGHFAGEHYGGFVSWDCDITKFINPDAPNLLVLGVRDDRGGICPFHTGGIIRDINLVALPEVYVGRFHAETTFDDTYTNANLTVFSRLQGGNGDLELTLQSPDGEITQLGTISLSDDSDDTSVFEIASPLKWDSEHPYLYTLTARLVSNGTCLETVSRQIGFRQIEKRGNMIYVNGDLLKLHGINRHDIHPITGRSITHELVEQDVRLFKEANINFIRTSHYPPRPDFLDLCDKYGIYVEDETAVAFLGQEIDCHESDPEYTDKFMNQFSELIERDRSHACVILWSLANECFWGKNLALENAYAHQEDPSRLTIFSYPITQQEDDDRADIWSMHYASWEQSPIALVDSFDRSCHEPVEWPVLHDESTHIPCYDHTDHRRDPGVRDFWGETISAFWNKLWNTDGALGCAIWAGIDDVWLAPTGRRFSPEWGIIDPWRRKKPEYWHVRKAYSPIHLTGEPENCGDHIEIAIENRFNHTNLSEIKIDWTLGDCSGSMQGPDLAPRMTGVLTFPVAYQNGNNLRFTFTDGFGNLLDESDYLLGCQPIVLPSAVAGAPELISTEETLTVQAPGFKLVFSQETGLITEGYTNDTLVLTGGPALHLTGLALRPWEKESFSAAAFDDHVQITIIGHYGKVRVQFTMNIDNSGLMETTYTVLDMPYASPRKLAMRIGDDTDSGGYEEVGISFTVPGELDTLSWNRKGLWTVYPEWHIGRLSGKTAMHYEQAVPGFPPEHDWQLDEKEQILFGQYDTGRRGTKDFRSMKSYITCAEIGFKDASHGFRVLSDGSDSVRTVLTHNPAYIINDRDPALVYEGSWLQEDVRFSSLNGTETWSNKAGSKCICHFTGTGCEWISSMDIIGGMAKVYVDGELMDDKISLGVGLSTPGIARGYEKDPGRLVYSIENLPYGEHTLTVEVVGEKTPRSMGAYVFIDHFRILGENDYGDTRLIINSEFNYPELSWGCYTKPAIKVATGYEKKVYTKLV